MSFNTMTGVAITLVVSIVVLTIGAVILTNLQDQVNTDDLNVSAGYNISAAGLTATQDVVDWYPIIIVAIVGALVIGIMVRAFGGQATA